MNIGIFDSGSGGLTVMRAIDKALPDRALVYLGDHANAPYGNRSPNDIYELTLRGLQRLFNEDCSIIVVACNTAAARGLRRLQREWLPFTYPDRRVLGVIVPVVEDVTGVQWIANQIPVARLGHAADVTVAVFATHHTVESRAFAGEIHKRAAHVEVWEHACPRLVPLIEENASESILRESVEECISLLNDRMAGKHPDVCILGCTHYPLVEHLFRQLLPQETRMLSQPSITARSLVAYLSRHPEFQNSDSQSRTFLTSGEPALASRIASRFYGRDVIFNHCK